MESLDRAEDQVRSNKTSDEQSQDQMTFCERVRYCVFNGADYLIKNIIG